MFNGFEVSFVQFEVDICGNFDDFRSLKRVRVWTHNWVAIFADIALKNLPLVP